MEKRNNERAYASTAIATSTSRSPASAQPSGSATVPEEERSSCFCFESDDDSTEKIRLKYTKKKLARGCLSNITICLILIGYTFLGAIIFLAIEGGSVFYAMSHKNVGPTFASVLPRFNGSSWLDKQSGEDPRAKTVENIWEITVSLNILYKENWTRLAAQEITRFQESLVKRITDEMTFQASPPNELKSGDKVEWTLGRAFLYSLTILTTIVNLTAMEWRIIKERKRGGLHAEHPGRESRNYVSTQSQSALRKFPRSQLDDFRKLKSYIRISPAVLGSAPKKNPAMISKYQKAGYGNLVPKTGLGKAVTMGYAAIGIPLVLLYLSSVGSLLSSCARNIFTRSLCCCLCSNCGYCCYDEKRMQEKERRMRKKRERREYEQRMQGLRTGQEPFYVRSASAYTTSTTNNLLSPLEESKPARSASVLDAECLSNDTSFVDSKSGSHFLAPLLLCLVVMIIYIGGGAFILYKLEETWSYFESIFFCFMVLSTIGFGDSISNDTITPGRVQYKTPTEEATVWFCSIYILCGLALTSMCFNVVHEEIVQRLKSHYIIVNNLSGSKENSVNSFKMTTTATFTEEPSSNEYLSS